MRDLRLIGVHDDGEHLVVIDDATGEEYRLRIDDPLRAAARRDRPRLGQLQIAIDNNVRPREVQAMIRAGATADEVCARTGWDLDKIARFEGPVLAEREHVAERAQAVRMRGATQSGDQETLGDRARARFAGRGVESSSVEWDARRSEDGQWTVSATFVAGGRERNATWWFDVPGMSVVAKNDEAKWLSEADAPAGPVPSSVHRPTAVFDVEVEESRAERAQRADPDELIASMREHSGARGRRRGGRRRHRGADPAAPDDALPFDTGDERPPAARGPHAKDVAAQDTAVSLPDRQAPSTQGSEESAEGEEPTPTPTTRTAAPAEAAQEGATPEASTADGAEPTEAPAPAPETGSDRGRHRPRSPCPLRTRPPVTATRLTRRLGTRRTRTTRTRTTQTRRARTRRIGSRPPSLRRRPTPTAHRTGSRSPDAAGAARAARACRAGTT
ncbi:septation protein SepH [Janibacter sp. DB-40]|uniref:septation protein SepH n=1 Tax=Janibacter sp. DB-40 TaxID=3028808 RepID=UPI0024074152|nr:septation protein SepH [Janibacter sp. DB-40]